MCDGCSLAQLKAHLPPPTHSAKRYNCEVKLHINVFVSSLTRNIWINLDTFTFWSRRACQAADNKTAESTKLEVHTCRLSWLWLWPPDIWACSVQPCTPRKPTHMYTRWQQKHNQHIYLVWSMKQIRLIWEKSIYIYGGKDTWSMLWQTAPSLNYCLVMK